MHRRRGRAALLPVAVLLASLGASSSISIAAEDAAQDSTGSDQELAAAMAFRQGLGLRSDIITVRGSLTSAAYPDRSYGAPLRSEEAAIVRVREEYSWRFVPVLDQAVATSDVVGSFLDAADGRTLTILTSSDPQSLQIRLADLVPAGGSLLVKHSLLTSQQVNELVASVAADFESYPAFSAHFDPQTERIVLGVDEELGETSLQSAAERARARFGDLVTVVRSTKPRPLACTLEGCGAKGGLKIIGFPFAGSSDDEECTSAFVARSNGGAMRMLTAGHCIRDNGGHGYQAHFSYWRNDSNTTVWGANVSYVLWGGGNTDSGTFALSPSIPTVKNQYYVSANKQPSILAARTDGQMSVGMLVC